jgi:hypothetical protein
VAQIDHALTQHDPARWAIGESHRRIGGITDDVDVLDLTEVGSVLLIFAMIFLL